MWSWIDVNPGWSTGKGRKRTLIIVKIMLTGPKTAWVGVPLEASFTRFVASMATFNKVRALSRRFCRLEFVSMVGTRGGCEITAWRAGCARPHTMGGHFVLVQTAPFVGHVVRRLLIDSSPSPF